MVNRQIGATAPKFLTKRRCLAKMRAPYWSVDQKGIARNCGYVAQLVRAQHS